jgi:hypothetical protein
MLRYLLLATIIVLGVAMAVAGWVNRDAIRIKIASVYVRVHPKPQPSNEPGVGSSKGLRGDAPWALSALPECLIQTSETTGPLAYVLRHVPSGATPVAVPGTLRYADCTIELAGDEAVVRRGDDRFRIPPHVRFFQAPGILALLRLSSNGNDLRVYEPTRP